MGAAVVAGVGGGGEEMGEAVVAVLEVEHSRVAANGCFTVARACVSRGFENQRTWDLGIASLCVRP
jgi:hypothetical protein